MHNFIVPDPSSFENIVRNRNKANEPIRLIPVKVNYLSPVSCTHCWLMFKALTTQDYFQRFKININMETDVKCIS